MAHRYSFFVGAWLILVCLPFQVGHRAHAQASSTVTPGSAVSTSSQVVQTPGSPTLTISAGSISRATVTPTSAPPIPSPTALAIPRPTGIPTPRPPVNFLLYAARVGHVNSPGDLSGLAEVRPGTSVWLMMYYVIKSVPRTVPRTTSYSVSYQGRSVFDVSFQGKVGLKDLGRFSRYTAYTVPQSAAYGRYYFHATLSIGGKQETKVWGFNVGRQEQLATQASATSPDDQPTFLLYAARVSPVQSSMVLSGLTRVPKGTRVWLTMYYVVKRVPASMPRTATYVITHRGRAIFKAASRSIVGPNDLGRFAPAIAYTPASSMPRGKYLFRATLTIGGKSETKEWGFDLSP